jgi:hypothetical protein
MTTEIVWANRNLAMLARLYRLRNLQPAWNPHGDGQYIVTICCGGRAVNAVVDRGELISAWRGSEKDQFAIIRSLAEAMRLVAADK